MRVDFIVEGKPITQGSMTTVYNRKTHRPQMRHTQALPLAKWRTKVANAAREAGAIVTQSPVTMSIVFGMPRPKTHLNRDGSVKAEFQDALPMHRDLDKLVRAIFDALTGVCYEDDKQIVDLHAIRVYGTHTMVDIRSVAWDDAARMAQDSREGISARQLPLPLLR